MADVETTSLPLRQGASAAPRAARKSRKGKLPWVTTGLLVAMIVCALLTDVIVPHDPYKISIVNRLLPPFWVEGGKVDFLLGTDSLGRDILSRVIMGARMSLLASLLAVLLGGITGTVLGMISGYLGGWYDAVIMRVTDAMISLPLILIALLFAVRFGPSFTNVILVLGIVMWAKFARLARGETLSQRERDYVALARIAGCSSARILWRHILPNIVNSLVVLATLQVSWVILAEASLSFLGAGVPPPIPSWGAMIAEGRNDLTTLWWITFFPGLALFITVFAVTSLGDWLRDVLDPKMR